MDAQIGFADALRRIFPTALASYLQFRGWIRRETLSDQMLLTFLSEATGGAIVIGVDDVVESLLLNLCLAGVSPPPLSRWIMPERISSETGRG